MERRATKLAALIHTILCTENIYKRCSSCNRFFKVCITFIIIFIFFHMLNEVNLICFHILSLGRGRSSRSQIFFKIGVLKKFTIFTGKLLCWSLFLMKLQAFMPATLLKKRLQHRRFPVNIAKFLRTAFL